MKKEKMTPDEMLKITVWVYTTRLVLKTSITTSIKTHLLNVQNILQIWKSNKTR